MILGGENFSLILFKWRKEEDQNKNKLIKILFLYSIFSGNHGIK